MDKFLASKPLRGVISSRQGPGGKKLDYMPGEVVTQTLNEAFGYDGWCLEVKNTMREVRGSRSILFLATCLVKDYII